MAIIPSILQLLNNTELKILFEKTNSDPSTEASVEALSTTHYRSCNLGYVKCPKNQPCKCMELCGPYFEEVFVETPIMFDFATRIKTMERYCLPKKQISDASAFVSYNRDQVTKNWNKICTLPFIFSGPECTTPVACQNKLAIYPFQNFLLDTKLNRAIRFTDLSFDANDPGRYVCSCNSPTSTGQKLIPYGLNCIVDQCLEHVFFSKAAGFDPTTQTCDCGDFLKTKLHKLPNGTCSPCRTGDYNNQTYASAICNTEYSPVNLAPPCKRFRNSNINCTEVQII